MPLGWIVKLIRLLNSNRKEGEIAGGFAFGLWLALIPAGNLLWFALFLVTFFLKINLGAELLSLALLKLLVPLADPALDPLGLALLGITALRPAWTAVYNLPIAPLTRFNNSLVMGGFAAGAVLFAPAHLGGKALVRAYRGRIQERIKASKAYRWFTRLPLVSRLLKAAGKAGQLARGEL